LISVVAVLGVFILIVVSIFPVRLFYMYPFGGFCVSAGRPTDGLQAVPKHVTAHVFFFRNSGWQCCCGLFLSAPPKQARSALRTRRFGASHLQFHFHDSPRRRSFIFSTALAVQFHFQFSSCI
jgi:hypothetical protein